MFSLTWVYNWIDEVSNHKEIFILDEGCLNIFFRCTFIIVGCCINTHFQGHKQLFIQLGIDITSDRHLRKNYGIQIIHKNFYDVYDHFYDILVFLFKINRLFSLNLLIIQFGFFRFYQTIILKINIILSVSIEKFKMAIKFLREAFLQADLFSNSQIIKYKGENQYKTIPGAIISLSMIIAIIIAFSSMIISMVEKTTINSSLEVKNIADPTLFQLDDFPFGIGVRPMSGSDQYFDLVNGSKLFEIFAAQSVMENGVFKRQDQVQLQQCTKQHWRKLPSVVQDYDKLQFEKWLCLPLNKTYEIQGCSLTKEYKTISISLRMCVNSTSNGNSCAKQTQIEDVLNRTINFAMVTSFINPVINPNQPDHIEHYLQSKNILIFSRNIAASIAIQLSQYNIQTDVTFLPFQSIENQKGYISLTLGIKQNFAKTRSNTLASIRILKGSNQLNYKRTVLKLSEVVSYMGGLMGFVVSLMFFMKNYTEFSFEIALSTDLFYQKSFSQENLSKSKNEQNQFIKENQENHENQEKQENQEAQQNKQKKPPQQTRQKFKFSLLKYLQFYTYKIAKFFKKDQSQYFDTAKKMQSYRQQITKQLDIKILLQRIIKLQSYISFILDKNQIQGFRNMQQMTVQKAKNLRSILNKNPNQQDQSQKSQQTQNKNDQNLDKKEIISNKQQSDQRLQNIQISIRNHIKNKQSPQSSGTELKKQQLIQYIPVNFIKDEIFVDNQQKSQTYNQFIEHIGKSNKSINNLKELGKKANDTQLKKKIWTNLKVQVRRSISKMIEQEQISEMQFRKHVEQNKPQQFE